jgi:hypothetical protein
MRRTVVFVGLFLVVGAASARSDEKQAPVTPGVPPRLVTVLGINEEKGELELVDRTVRFVSEAQSANTNEGGNIEVRSKLFPVYEEKILGTAALESTEVAEAGGKTLGRDEVLKRVTAGSVVVVSMDGKQVAPRFLKLLAKETLVIVSPPLAVQMQSRARGR